ncbi:efflux RND transporter permease subunit [Ferrimonas balearica]|uniref:efflux RND transporter permease subunit n=1 Tax=Ferrimonas balearica TaxID=44012 RepID=UPI001C59E760|nr:efflux RND transporter permease subunit [Ferrimonas balearica]MBW3139711.1 efflux RND transporter permease subunit [Ferrimonas balearica]MBW3164735.1 efflux RND transporter permease subunit [Ferrimonas balearica]MBY6107183.1 efflux RND transporter permease subunit [Ferrimonas balearica]
MTGVIAAALARSRSVLMVFVLLLIAGSLTYRSIPKESEPDITIPVIYVSITHDGISPEDAERMLVRPMEQELRSIEGIDELRATAAEGHASLVMEFDAGFDPKVALADVRDKVTLAKAKLPADTEEPTVHEVTLAEENPVITVTLSGPIPERTLVQIARTLRDRLESLPEVLEVEIGGDREDLLEILIDPLLLESYQLEVGDIATLVARSNRLVPAGTMDTGEGRFAIKVPSVFESLKDILELPVKVQGDQVVTVGDIATVRRSFKDPNSFARLNGQPALSLEVKKRPGENIISTVAKVKGMMDAARDQWPEALEVTFTGDQSEDVENMLTDLQNNVLSAILLVVIVVIAALGARSAALVGLAIPGSFLTGILILATMGLTVNIVVLFALIMAVGMLVDGAIVVTEYADRRMSEGAARKRAYAEAAQRMSWPIIASTATTLAAFAPLLFWPGIMGEFMKFFPLTLIATLTASLLMALIFVPALGGVFGKPLPLSPRQREAMRQAETGDIRTLPGVSGRYVRMLDRAIRHPWKVLGVVAMGLVLIITAYARFNHGTEFFPKVEPSGLNLYVRGYGDLSIYEKDTLMQRVEARLADMPELETLYARTDSGDRIGYLRLNLVEWDQRETADQLLPRIRERLEGLAGLEIEVRKDENGPSGGKALQLELASRLPEALNDAVYKVRRVLEADGRFLNIEDTGSKPGIEWQLLVDRGKAARFAADATAVGNTVQFVTSGLKVGEYRPDDADQELDIRARFPADKRHILRLDQLRLNTPHGQVPVSNFVERTAAPKVDSIRRIDGRRVMTIKADLAPGVQLGAVMPELQALLPELKLHPSVELGFTGENEEQAESQQFLVNAFGVALFIMAVILVTQFNSFYQAFLILTAVLLSTAGVLLGLMVAGKPFNIVMCGLGIIALAGIVVNNNIVLIDTYNVLRAQGLSAHEAILRTGAQRLRPVMLTTITTILGLMPMVLETNIDLIHRVVQVGGPSTQWWSQLATTVAGGLAFATVLTLVLTPALLALRAGRQARKAQRAETAEAVPAMAQ